MKKTIFTGAGVAIITPMNEDDSINYELLGQLIDFQIDNGTDAIIICGTTGESSTMTDEEHVEAIRFAVKKTAGRVPVIAGAGSNHTSYAQWMSKHGITVEDWQKMIKSFSVVSQTRQATRTWKHYGVDSTPSIGIAGRYITAPHLVGTRQGPVDMTLRLIQMIRKEK